MPFRRRKVDTVHLRDGAVATDKLADLAVDTAKLADLAVDTAKLADLAVDYDKSEHFYTTFWINSGLGGVAQGTLVFIPVSGVTGTFATAADAASVVGAPGARNLDLAFIGAHVRQNNVDNASTILLASDDNLQATTVLNIPANSTGAFSNEAADPGDSILAAETVGGDRYRYGLEVGGGAVGDTLTLDSLVAAWKIP